MKGGTTIDAAKYLENLPTRGPEYVLVTLPRLAQQLGIPFELTQLSKKDQDRRKGYDALKRASDFMIESANIDLLATRGFTQDDAIKYKIGTTTFASLLTHLRQRFTDPVLRSVGIIDGKDEQEIYRNGENLFISTGLIFTVCDRYGNPIGFARRDTAYEEKKARNQFCQKYSNTITTEYYNKASTLFLINNAVKAMGIAKEAYVFEGYTDGLTVHKYGIENAVAMGSAAFSQGHLDLLLEAGAETIILCLDNDDGGIKGTLRAINDLFKGRKDVCLKILMFDKPGEDPDSYIKKFGIDAFKKQKKVDYVEWLIYTQTDATYNEVILNRLIDEIIDYTDSPILYSRYAAAFADKWHLDKSTVEDEIKMAKERSTKTTNLEIDKIVSTLVRDLDHTKGESVIPVLEKALDAIETKKMGTINKREIIERDKASWELIETEYLNMVSDPIQFKTLPRFSSQIELPKSECLIAIPGREHHGKSTLLRQMGIDIAEHNKDVLVLYYSLDDSKRLSTPGFIGSMLHVRMKDVKNLNSEHTPKEVKDKILGAFNRIRGLTNFKLKDASECNSIADIRRDILMYRNIYGNKKINIFIDALNDLRDCTSSTGDKRAATEEAISRLKTMTVRYDCNIWFTAHLRKQQGRPTNDDIKETGSIAYLADVILLVYNAFLAEGVATPLKQAAPEGRCYEFYPIMDINISKNKVTEARGRKLYTMHSDEGWFEELPEARESELLKAVEVMNSKDGKLRVFSGYNGAVAIEESNSVY